MSPAGSAGGAAPLGRAVTWAYVMNWTEQGVSALVLFVLASMLGPRIFGIVAMALLILSLLEIFLDQGFSTALIQRKDLDTGHPLAAFWIIVSMGWVFFGLSWGLAGLWAELNNTPEVALVLQVLALKLPINALSRVPNALILRSMDYRLLALRNSSAVVIGGLAGIAAAAAGWGVWALVVQQLTKELIGSLLVWRLSAWRPRFSLQPQCVRDLWAFSRANVVTRLGVYANAEAPALLIGLYLGPVAIGVYRLASRVVSLVMQVGSRALQTVSLPALARSQDDPVALQQSARALLRLSMVATLPLVGLMAVLSEPIMAAIGPSWTMGAPVLAVLCAAAVVQSFSQFTVPILQAASRPGIAARIIWFEALAGIALLLLVAELSRGQSEETGLLAVASSRVAVAAVCATIAVTFFALPRVGLTLLDVLKAAGPAAVAAVGGMATAWALGYLSFQPGAYPVFAVLALRAAVAGLVVVALLLLLEPRVRELVARLPGFHWLRPVTRKSGDG